MRSTVCGKSKPDKRHDEGRVVSMTGGQWVPHTLSLPFGCVLTLRIAAPADRTEPRKCERVLVSADR